MKKLNKFTLKESESITSEEMKFVRGGDTTRDLTLYDCKVGADGTIKNLGQKCQYDEAAGGTVIIVGTCKSNVIYEPGADGRLNPKLVAYCEMD